jgi:hypothetical protein
LLLPLLHFPLPACLRACPPVSVFFSPPSSVFFAVAFSLFSYPPQSAHANEFLVPEEAALAPEERKKETRKDGRKE